LTEGEGTQELCGGGGGGGGVEGHCMNIVLLLILFPFLDTVYQVCILVSA
jgi:hypothetical protein